MINYETLEPESIYLVAHIKAGTAGTDLLDWEVYFHHSFKVDARGMMYRIYQAGEMFFTNHAPSNGPEESPTLIYLLRIGLAKADQAAGIDHAIKLYEEVFNAKSGNLLWILGVLQRLIDSRYILAPHANAVLQEAVIFGRTKWGQAKADVRPRVVQDSVYIHAQVAKPIFPSNSSAHI